MYLSNLTNITDINTRYLFNLFLYIIIPEVDIGGNDCVTQIEDSKMMASFVVPPATYASALKGRPIDKMTGTFFKF